MLVVDGFERIELDRAAFRCDDFQRERIAAENDMRPSRRAVHRQRAHRSREVLTPRVCAAPHHDVDKELNVIEDHELMACELGEYPPIDGFLERERVRFLHRLDDSAHIEERAAAFLVELTEH